MNVTATLYDAFGVEIETLEGEASNVAMRCARFIVLHSTDPDENGAAASAGRVEFKPSNN